MTKLKEAYDIKKHLISNDINELGNILKEYADISTISINSDNTLYLESDCGIDSIKNNLNLSVIRWIDKTIETPKTINIKTPISMIYNTLPLSNNSCIIRI